MDVRQLEYVVAVADHGTFTKAAKASYVAQPTLSHGIRTLEAELGVELFLRLGRSVRPTPAGEEVIASARRVLDELSSLRQATAEMAGLERGRLDLVALATLAAQPLAGLIGQFRRSHPHVQVRVTEPDSSADLVAVVVSGQAELGLADLNETSGAQLVEVELVHQEILAVFPPHTPGRGPVRAADLFDGPLVARPPGTSLRRLLDQLADDVGRVAYLAVEIEQRDAIVPLVIDGLGAALLPVPLAREAAGAGAVVRHVQPRVVRRVGLLHRAGELSPAAAAMVDLAISWSTITTDRLDI